MAADYKANRTPMPGDLAEQVPWVHEACEAMGVPILTLGRLRGGRRDRHAGDQGRRARPAGGDRHRRQGFLPAGRDGIRVYNPRDEGTWYDADGVMQKFGVAPAQVCDVLALMGDSIDNVKGVPGIGEKGARDLIAHLRLARVAAGACRPRSSRRSIAKACSTYADQARQSRELVTIRTDVDVPFEIERFRFRGADRERCYALFSKMEFRTLVPEFAPTASSVDKDYALIESTEELTALVAEMKAAGRFSMKVITDGTAPVRATLVGIAVSTGTARRRATSRSVTRASAAASRCRSPKRSRCWRRC